MHKKHFKGNKDVYQNMKFRQYYKATVGLPKISTSPTKIYYLCH